MPRRAAFPQRFPAFRATASDQPRDANRDQFAEARLALSVAYTPSQPIIDTAMFAGRSGVLTAVIRSIEDQRLNVVAFGERGIGKTSLMHVVSHAAREARYVVSYISCGADSSFDETIRVVARDIPLIFHRDFGPNALESERGGDFSVCLPGEPLSVRQATDVLAKVVGTRVLVVLDEFDKVESSSFRRNIAELIKTLSDRAIRVQVMVAGVAASLAALVDHIPSIQRSIFALAVPRMTGAEIHELIRLGEERSALRFEGAAHDLVVTAANGLPYLASLLCHHAGLEAISRFRLLVAAGDVDVAVANVLGEQQSRISKRALARIAACVAEGAGPALGGLANLAQLSGGAFVLDDGASSPEEPACASGFAKKLAAEGVLLERSEEAYGVVYRFAEDELPNYLWLLAAQARFREEDKKIYGRRSS